MSAVGVVVRRSLPSSARVVNFECAGCSSSLTLRLHADAKTAPRGVWGSTVSATYAQAFHLPSGRPSEGGACDGATDYCLRHCYASAMERRFSAFASGALANLETLQHVYRCDSGRGLRAALRAMVGHAVDHMVRDGISPTFRWHSDGDCWLGDRSSSDAYARAIRAVSAEFGASHGLRSWIYTRSLGRVRYLVGSEHLSVYVSADPDNVVQATDVADRWGANLAILGDDSDQVQLMLSGAEYGGAWSRALLPVSMREMVGARRTSRALRVGAIWCAVTLFGAHAIRVRCASMVAPVLRLFVSMGGHDG